jgi:hypothetical protein
MTRRLWLFAAVLFIIAVPALARRRAVTPGAPTHCVQSTLVSARYAQVLAMDEQFGYFVDESDAVARVPRFGGEVQELTDPLDDWLPLSIAVDATHVYLGALPFEALFLPGPGAILTVPKSGGVVSVRCSPT